MRCPKCQYISFGTTTRCRNCGYEFSLAVQDVDVPNGRDELALGHAHETAQAVLDMPLTSAAESQGSQPDSPLDPFPHPIAADLPLFTDRVADDQAPLVTPPAVPRPPLGVRRANPAVRSRPRATGADELPLDAHMADAHHPVASGPRGHPAAAPTRAAGILRRAVAGLVDLIILGGVCAAVVYLTLRLCGLTVEQWRVLPAPPLVAFLLLWCGGYVVLFTAAGGQTIGKMLAGIRVVASDGAGRPRRVPFGTAMIRAIACLGSVLALGAGFLPVLFSADRRAFHDRVAETRVVPA